MKIEVGTLYKTRDGKKVRIYATDGLGDYPIHGAVYTTFDTEILYGWDDSSWDEKGESVYESSEDIVSEWEEPKGLAQICKNSIFDVDVSSYELWTGSAIKPRKGFQILPSSEMPKNKFLLISTPFPYDNRWIDTILNQTTDSIDALKYAMGMCSCGGKLNTHKPTCPENKKDETVYETHPFYYLDESPERYAGMKPYKKCECGSDSLGSPKHSSYCPKFTIEED